MVVRTKGKNWQVQMVNDDKRSRLAVTIEGTRYELKQKDAEDIAAAIEEALYAH